MFFLHDVQYRLRYFNGVNINYCFQLKLNDSYLSAVSSSLQNITNQWSKSRARLSDVSHNESSDSENSLLEDIQEREELIDVIIFV